MRRFSLSALLLLASCSGGGGPPVPGDTSFTSTAPPGGGSLAGGADTTSNAPPTTTPGPKGTGTTPSRTVEETDIYRLDGDRLYFLNSYRGLMVFDVSDVDHPTLLGRAPIYGSPVEMVVRNGVATVVVADWYGTLADGTPFHGSVVRGLDATDPAHIKTIGEATLGGWVTDTRVVGDVLYAVSMDYGWVYGWAVPAAAGGGGVVVVGGGTGTATTSQGPSVIVSSVSFAGGSIQRVGHVEYPGWGGVFHVTANAVLLAHDATTPDGSGPARTRIEYLDISDPGGAIVARGSITVDGRIQGWGADNGRWNLDFADGKTAHVVGCAGTGWCSGVDGYVVSTVDFSKPDAPALLSDLDVPATGWSVAARFVGDRLYLAPASGYWESSATPFMIVDLANPLAPKVAGTATVPGTVWNLLPGPDETMFALGNEWARDSTGSAVSLSYVDVANAASPRLLGTARFGDGWAWTPAAGTFKAFTVDAQKGLVVLPFSGWSQTSQSYTNGLQLVEISATSIRTSGAARTRGWVERGIFAGGRLLALSDEALSVIDYSRPSAPVVTAELTLARNVVAAQPDTTTIAQVSTDFWGNDTTTSEVRVLPIADAEELRDVGNVPTVSVAGTNARVFRNGALAYLVTDVHTEAACTGGATGPTRDGSTPICTLRSQQVQVVDLSGGGARLRGKVQLPADSWGWGWWGGYYYWNWYNGAEVVQVGARALAFRRWEPIWDATGKRLDDNSKLYVVDLANPDAPSLASVTITDDANGWWGNLRVVGTTLYATHYEWVAASRDAGNGGGEVRYYVDRIDLSNLAHPRVAAKINVPGMLIGGAGGDPSILYFIDYRWDGNRAWNDIDVAKVRGSTAQLLSRISLDGYAGGAIVRDDRAYLTVQSWDADAGTSHLTLHAIDLTDPARPVDRAASDRGGWGWLLDVEGDRALVTSGWGSSGIDIYKLKDGAAPRFDQFVRTLGWWTSSVARQGNTLFLASGTWGVQRIDL